MALCRELTKDYEQIRRGTIHEINESVANDPPRGEMVLVIAGASEDEADPAQSLSVEELAELAMQYAQAHGMRIKDAIAEVIGKHPNADGTLANRKQVYNAVLALQRLIRPTGHPVGIAGPMTFACAAWNCVAIQAIRVPIPTPA